VPIALDYTSRIGPAALQAAGVTVVCRYLSWLYRYGGQTHSTVNPKIIQRAEYDELAAAGVPVVRTGESHAHDGMGGSSAGLAHAAEAVRQARLLGHPPGAVIAGSADFDMARDDWSAAAQSYAQAFADVVTGAGYRAGAYGPWDVLAWLAGSVPAVTWYWQAGMSTSWSGGRNAKPWPGAHLRQRGTKTVGGVSGDWNEILTTWEEPMSAHSDDILGRWSQGFPTLSDGTELTPVTWRVRDEAWQKAVDDTLAALAAAVAGLGTGGVDLDALADKVALRIGTAIAKAAGQLGTKQ
jgi:hypothetical protein